MKKIIAALLLTVSLPANAADHRLCTELSVRLTAFSMLAHLADSKDQYQSKMYELLLNGNANAASQKILISMIELAWEGRSRDVRDLSMQFYDRCVSE